LNSADVVRQKTRFGQGNSVVHINAGNLSEILVSLPPVDEQNAIASVLQTAQRDVQQLTELLRRLKTEKAALMQQLLTGKRRVRATEMTT
jgi:type I restriction enzyme S subunit